MQAILKRKLSKKPDIAEIPTVVEESKQDEYDADKDYFDSNEKSKVSVHKIPVLEKIDHLTLYRKQQQMGNPLLKDKMSIGFGHHSASRAYMKHGLLKSLTDVQRTKRRSAFALTRKENSIWGKLTLNRLNSSIADPTDLHNSGAVSPIPTPQEKGQDLIQRGSIVISNNPSQGGPFNRRMSTFSNLPIETRLGDSVNVAELLNSLGKKENTYRLQPVKGVPNTDHLQTYVKELVTKELADFSGTYSTFTAKYYVKILAETVKQEIKDKIDPRYKIVCLSNIGENNGQDLRMKSTYLWDKEMDRYFDVNLALDNGGCKLYIVLKVFLVYYN